MTMFTNLKFENVTDAVVEIEDLQLSVQPGETATIQGKTPEDISRSEDLVRAVVTDKIIVFDLVQEQPISAMAAVSLIASGGGRTFVNLDGIPRVHASPRPLDMTTYFTAAGDDIHSKDPFKVKGHGDVLLFHLTSSDKSKSVDLQFDEEVQVKDGFMICVGAPFGASMNVDVLIPKGHPTGHPLIDLHVARLANRVPLLETGWFPMDVADGGRVYQGWIVRVTVNNAMGNRTFDDGSENPEFDIRQDPPATFKVSGRLEMFRKKTVFLPG